jgi:hypothetical protein
LCATDPGEHISRFCCGANRGHQAATAMSANHSQLECQFLVDAAVPSRKNQMGGENFSVPPEPNNERKELCFVFVVHLDSVWVCVLCTFGQILRA